MLRSALLVTPFLLLGCAAAPTAPRYAIDAPVVIDAEARRSEALVAPEVATEAFTDFAVDPQGPPPMPPRPRHRVTLKGGYYDSTEDGFDDGYIINLAWMQPMSERFSREVEIGYLDASGSDGLVDRDVWAIPLLVNGRINVPVGEKIELYGGIGLGTFYYDAEASAPGVSVSADGFLFGGDAFFGGDIRLGESLYVGLEGKYYLTDEASDLGGGLDAYVWMLTVGFGR